MALTASLAACNSAKGVTGIPVNRTAPVFPTPTARRSDNMLGLTYMAASMFLFAAVDTQAKYLTATLHPLQIVWCRQLCLLFGVFVLLAIRGLSVLRTQHPWLQIGRGGVAACSATLFIVAVSFVPLADAVAVAFVAPFIVTVLGAILLREPVGLRRWIAVTIGFLGTLVVIRPGFEAFHPALLLVVVAAIFFAMRQIVSRVLGSTDRTSTTVAYTALVGSFVLTIPLPFVWKWPSTTQEIVILTTMSVMAALAEFLVIKSLEAAHAVVVAPVQYTLIIWGTMYGFLVFGQLPDFWTWTGAAIIIATGFYTLRQERLATIKPNS